MITIRITIFCALMVLASCQESKFVYDPTKPYPDLEVGSYWKDKFDRRGLQHGIESNGFLFVNTINISEKDYLYCLNLKTGRVAWKSEVESYSFRPVIISREQLYYISHVNKIYSFTLNGTKLWESSNLIGNYGSYKINSKSGNLIVSTKKQVYEYDKHTGQLIRR